MDVSLIPIGNSKGIRLSKALIEKYNFQNTIELILENGFIILRPKTQARKGWEKAFKKMHKNGDDQLMLSDVYKGEDFEHYR